ncbi:MAG: S16 family serine protease [Candidatus Margulisiibacteriota bacterium]
MKKVISFPQIKPVTPNQLPLYQQIEFLTHWQHDLTQRGIDQKETLPTITIQQLLAIQQSIAESEETNLNEYRLVLNDIRDQLIEYSHCIGFKSIEQLFLAEFGCQAAIELSTEYLNMLIFLNQWVIPEKYEKRRLSPRSKLNTNENQIDELSIEHYLITSAIEDQPFKVNIEFRYQDELIVMTGLAQGAIEMVQLPNALDVKIRQKRDVIFNLKYPRKDSDVNENEPRNRRKKVKDLSIPTEFRTIFYELTPLVTLIKSCDEKLEQALITSHKLWLRIQEKCPKTSFKIESLDEKKIKNKCLQIIQAFDQLTLFFNENKSQQAHILGLLMKHNKPTETLHLIQALESNSPLFEQIPEKLTQSIIALKEDQKNDEETALLTLHQIDMQLNQNQHHIKCKSSIEWLKSEINALHQLDHSDTHFFKRMERLQSIMKIPFGKYSGTLERISLSSPLDERQAFLNKIQGILDSKLHGQTAAKKAIFQTVGQMIMNPDEPPKPLLFIGPPGTGKTSLAKSIAAALGRRMGCIGLGGEPDKHSLKGCDLVYESPSMGAIGQTLIQTQQMNPVIVLDEVDKMGEGRDGKATQHQIMELTDASISDWKDEYLKININKQGIWFILTANHRDQLDPILLDRLQVVEMGGQTTQEKRMIAKHHIIPRSLKKFNFPNHSINFTDEQIDYILDHIPFEPGCRQLADIIRQILSDINLKRIRSENQPKLSHQKPLDPAAFRLPYQVSFTDITGITAPLNVQIEKRHEINTIGLINGLYATTHGCGGILPIQVIASTKIKSDIITGKLGDTMRESIHVARTINNEQKLLPSPRRQFSELENPGLHIHTPDMATEKDGPSAGAAITIAILSALNGLPIRCNYAITGEIDIHGNVLPVGGIHQKLVGAKKANIEHVILPIKNKQDYHLAVEKDPELSHGLNVTFIQSISEALPCLFELSKHKESHSPLAI